MKRLAVLFVLCGACAQPPDRSLPAEDGSGLAAAVHRVLAEARNHVSHNPEDAGAWGRLGAVYEAHELYPEAHRAFSVAAELAPQDARWALSLANVLDFRGAEPAEIQAAFERAAELSERDPHVLIDLGRAALRYGNLEVARAAYEEAIEQDERLYFAHRGLGQTLFAMGETEAARDALQRAIQVFPADAVGHSSLARCLRALGDEAGALDAETKAAGLAPIHGLDSGGGRFAYTFEPVDPTSALMRAQAQQARGFFGEAIPDYELLIESLPDNADAHFQLATCRVQMRQFDEATKDLTRAIELDPDFVEAIESLARLYTFLNAPVEARSLAKRALELGVYDPMRKALLEEIAKE